MALAALVALGAGCAPPTAPGPEVRPTPDGRGRVPALDVAPSAGCAAGQPPAPGQHTLVVEVDGARRRALLRVPDRASAGVSAEPAPVLVSLHPFAIGPEGWEQYSGLADAASARGYVVLTPEGSQPGPRWAVPGGLATGIDDIGAVSALLDEVEDTLCVDRNRQFAAGFSAGAAMAQALSCTLPWRIAAVAASGGANLTELCPDSPPTDVLVLHGSVDPVAPPGGSYVVFAPPLGLHVERVVQVDALRAGCDEVPATSTPFPSVRVQRFGGCEGPLRVEYWELLGAGHTWAGASPGLDLLLGPTLAAPSANDVALDFFDGI